MRLFAMICACSILFDSSKLSNLMLFLPCPVISAVCETVIICNLAMSFWACSSDFWRYLSVHVLLCFTCTSCPCLLFACWGAVAYCFDACKMPSCCFGQIVVISCWSACVTLLLRFECALYATCLGLHVVSYYHVASLFWGVSLMFVCILHQCHV